ncbi:hypothetical protein FBR82_RS14005, partial [Enterococcus hirae]
NEQIDEIHALADVIARAKNLSQQEVIKAYGIDDLKQINEVTGKDLIRRLSDKVSSLMPKEEKKQEELFDNMNPPFDGKEVDISDDDLPF